jgi:flavorubredoxin
MLSFEYLLPDNMVSYDPVKNYSCKPMNAHHPDQQAANTNIEILEAMRSYSSNQMKLFNYPYGRQCAP